MVARHAAASTQHEKGHPVTQARKEMRTILAEIRDGRFARELAEEFDAGKPNFLERREAEQSGRIERVGAKLRPLMSWLIADE